MKKILLFLPLVLVGCSSQYSMPDGVNLNQYSYVNLPAPSDFALEGTADDSDISAVNEHLASLFQKEGIKVLDKTEVDTLPVEESHKVLTLKYQCRQTSGISSISLNLYDHAGRKVFTSSAKDGTGWNVMGSTLNALQRAFAGFAANYSRYDATLTSESATPPQAQEDLKKYAAEPEDPVKQKIAELKAANQKLQYGITKREQAKEPPREKPKDPEESKQQTEKLQNEIAKRLRMEEDFKKYTAELQETIEQKTAELKTVNQKLQYEISQHEQTKEPLREKTKEAEELKRQIEKLQNEIAEHLQTEKDFKKYTAELQETAEQKAAGLKTANIKLQYELLQYEQLKKTLEEKTKETEKAKQQIEKLQSEFVKSLQTQENFRKYNAELQETVKQKTAELKAVNQKLQDKIAQHEQTKEALKKKTGDPEESKQQENLKTTVDIDNGQLNLELLKAIEDLDVDTAKSALAAGANPNWVSGGNVPYSALDKAVSKTILRSAKQRKTCMEILKSLFNAGAKVESQNKEVLYFPIIHNFPDAVELLLENGADPIAEIGIKTPVELAEECEYSEIVGILIKYGGKPIPLKQATQLRLIDGARCNNILKIERALKNGAQINGMTRQGETVLASALTIGSNRYSYDTVKYLLQNGANPNLQAKEKSKGGLKGRPLHIIMLSSSPLLTSELDSEKKYMRLIVKELVKAGADIDPARYYDGKTPLHVAAKWNNLQGAKILIEVDAKMTPKDDEGKTPLDYAKSTEMTEFLKSRGARKQ